MSEEPPASPEMHVVVRRRRGRPRLLFFEGSVPVAEATVRWPHTMGYLEGFGLRRVSENEFVAPDSASFLQALIYYGVAQTKRVQRGIEKLRSVVEELELIELRLWAHYLREGYRRKKVIGMYRPARAFKTLFEV